MSRPSSTPAQSAPSDSESGAGDEEDADAPMTFSPTDSTPLPHAPGDERETER